MSERRAPLRTGVIGVGYLGALHASKYAALEDAELLMVFDTDRRRMEEIASRHACRAAPSLAAMLAAVEAVSIAVPTAAHAEVARRTAAAGVHMLIEKPLAASSSQGQRIAEAAERGGVIVQVGHLERFSPVFDDVRRLISRPRFIECHRLAPFAGRGCDTNVVYDVMIHDLDMLAFLVGRSIKSVEAAGVPVLSEQIDIANARLRFQGGCIANVTASRVSLKRERKLRIFQENAYVSMDFDAQRLVIAFRPQQRGTAESMDAIEVEEREFGQSDPLLSEVRSFVETVRAGTVPLVGIRDGLDAMAIADHVLAALEEPDPDE